MGARISTKANSSFNSILALFQYIYKIQGLGYRVKHYVGCRFLYAVPNSASLPAVFLNAYLLSRCWRVIRTSLHRIW
jgi:hypothetical protein